MIRIILIAIVFVVIVFLLYHIFKFSSKYLSMFFKVIFKYIGVGLRKIIALDFAYFSPKRTKIRKELDELFLIGLKMGKLKTEFQKYNDDEISYIIEYPNSSKLSVFTRYDINFISLTSGDYVTTEKIDRFKARRYKKHFEIKKKSEVEKLKTTISDVIHESEKVQYLEKLKEINEFRKENEC